MSDEKPNLAPDVMRRLLSVTAAKAEVAKLHTPTMRARIDALRRRHEAVGNAAPKDLLAWEGFVDGPAPTKETRDEAGDGAALLQAELAANPFRQVPKDEIARIIAETEAALSSLTPGSEEACAVILAAVEAGAPLDAFPLPPPTAVPLEGEPLVAAPVAAVELTPPGPRVVAAASTGRRTGRGALTLVVLAGVLLGGAIVAVLMIADGSRGSNRTPSASARETHRGAPEPSASALAVPSASALAVPSASPSLVAPHASATAIAPLLPTPSTSPPAPTNARPTPTLPSKTAAPPPSGPIPFYE